jgi:hypothetical protein
MPNGVLYEKATHPLGPNNTHQPPQYPVGAGLPAITPAQPTSLLKLATRTGVTKASVQCEVEVATIIKLAQSGIAFGPSCLRTTEIAHTSFL